MHGTLNYLGGGFITLGSHTHTLTCAVHSTRAPPRRRSRGAARGGDPHTHAQHETSSRLRRRRTRVPLGLWVATHAHCGRARARAHFFTSWRSTSLGPLGALTARMPASIKLPPHNNNTPANDFCFTPHATHQATTHARTQHTHARTHKHACAHIYTHTHTYTHNTHSAAARVPLATLLPPTLKSTALRERAHRGGSSNGAAGPSHTHTHHVPQAGFNTHVRARLLLGILVQFGRARPPVHQPCSPYSAHRTY